MAINFQASIWLAFLAATILILGAAYTLWLVKRVVFGEVGNEGVASLQDIGSRECFMLVVLATVLVIDWISVKVRDRYIVKSQTGMQIKI